MPVLEERDEVRSAKPTHGMASSLIVQREADQAGNFLGTPRSTPCHSLFSGKNSNVICIV